MDFTKYVAMLEAKALFFVRSDQLGDAFEGSISKANLVLRPEVYKEHPIPDETWRELSSFNERVRFWTFVHCWHMNYHESAAMWRLYSMTNHAIAITSTYDALCEQLPDNSYVGVVRYVDYAADFIPENNSFWPFVHKRRSFQHEHELRAVIQDLGNWGTSGLAPSPPETVRAVPVDLDTLLTKIVVAPTAPGWFFELVGAVTKRYGLVKSVEQSRLDERPIF